MKENINLDFINFFLGLAVGLATNLFSWWLLFHGIVPKVRFSPYISKTPSDEIGHDKSEFRYRVKYENSGGRAIIDLEVTASISIEGLGPSKDSLHIFLLPLNPDGNLSFRRPRLLPRHKTNRPGHISRFFINSAVEHLDRPPYPDNIREKARQGILTLEELLELGSKATVEVQAFGYDEFSGSRRLFLSHPYTVKDIKLGAFKKYSLGIAPPQEETSDEKSSK